MVSRGGNILFEVGACSIANNKAIDSVFDAVGGGSIQRQIGKYRTPNILSGSASAHTLLYTKEGTYPNPLQVDGVDLSTAVDFNIFIQSSATWYTLLTSYFITEINLPAQTFNGSQWTFYFKARHTGGLSLTGVPSCKAEILDESDNLIFTFPKKSVQTATTTFLNFSQTYSPTELFPSGKMRLRLYGGWMTTDPS